MAQLIGHTSGSVVPLAVTGWSFSRIWAGDYHTCAITTSGTALCWGLNDWGQLGDGTLEPGQAGKDGRASRRGSGKHPPGRDRLQGHQASEPDRAGHAGAFQAPAPGLPSGERALDAPATGRILDPMRRAKRRRSFVI